MQYPKRLSVDPAQERKFYPDTHGPRCANCGGHAPSRACRRCGRLPRLIKFGERWWREVER